MEERLQVGKATRSTPRIHPSLRALVSRYLDNVSVNNSGKYNNFKPVCALLARHNKASEAN